MLSTGGVVYPIFSIKVEARSARTCGDFSGWSNKYTFTLLENRTRQDNMTTIPNRQATAVTGRSDPSFGAAATISGDGVSPAARAAARGSPPGSAAATSIAEEGRLDGFFSRQRRITRSTFGSISFTCEEGLLGGVSR